MPAAAALGVAVSPAVLSRIDVNGDGELSQAEQRDYAKSVLHDLLLKVSTELFGPPTRVDDVWLWQIT